MVVVAVSSRLNPSDPRAIERSTEQRRQERTHPLDGDRIREAANFLDYHRSWFEQALQQPVRTAAPLLPVITELRSLAILVDDPGFGQFQADCVAS